MVKPFCPLSGSGLVNFTDLRRRAGTKKPGTWGDVPGGVSGLWCGFLSVVVVSVHAACGLADGGCGAVVCVGGCGACGWCAVSAYGYAVVHEVVVSPVVGGEQEDGCRAHAPLELGRALVAAEGDAAARAHGFEVVVHLAGKGAKCLAALAVEAAEALGGEPFVGDWGEEGHEVGVLS